jgi:hypothetical protein
MKYCFWERRNDRRKNERIFMREVKNDALSKIELSGSSSFSEVVMSLDG